MRSGQVGDADSHLSLAVCLHHGQLRDQVVRLKHEPDSRAANLGQLVIGHLGDVIVSVDGQNLEDTRELIDTVSAMPPGTEVELTVIRNGDRKKIEVELEEREEVGALPQGSGSHGGDQHFGVAEGDRNGAIGLLGKVSGRERDLGIADLAGDGDGVIGDGDGVAVPGGFGGRAGQVGGAAANHAQLGMNQSLVVARVQTDARLVEDVQDPHQAAADLRRQPDALCLATTEGGAGAVDGEVVEAHVGQGVDEDGARETARRLQNEIAQSGFRLRSSGTQLSVTFSIGIATAPENGRSGRALFRAADTALYHAKRSGRNQCAAVDDVDLEQVFSKAALYRLEASGMDYQYDFYCIYRKSRY